MNDNIEIRSIELWNEIQKQIYKEILPKFLYKPGTPLPDLSLHLNKCIEIRVHKDYISRTNKAFRFRNFYGNDKYTSDSDIVCILQHSEKLRVPDQEMEDKTFEAYSVIFKVLKSQTNYPSHLKNGIKSRRAQGYEGHSLKLETVCKRDWIGSD